ncbi:uncharacterized protein METZ01_LOCUS199401, partial [marine metagenome]
VALGSIGKVMTIESALRLSRIV